MTIGVIIIYLATITGLIMFNKIKPVIFRLLPVLLLFTTLTETLLLFSVFEPYRLWFYNIFSLIELLLWGTILYFTSPFPQRKIHIIVVLLLLIVSIIEIILRIKKGEFHTYTYRLFSAYMIVNCLYYFSQLINLKKQFSIWKDGFFWIFTGVLIFQVVFFFYLTAIEYPEFRDAPNVMRSFRIVMDIINGAYYIMLARGLICLSYYRP